jgi:sporulation protein YtfJ
MEQEKKHPIENMLNDSLSNLKGLVDINTVVGEQIKINDNTSIIPISKIGIGFVGGGGEYDKEKKDSNPPFASGSGLGVSVKPMGFIIIEFGNVKYVSTEQKDTFDKLLNIFDGIINKEKKNEKEEHTK